jgi:nitrous oxidase accessory protein
VIVLKKNVTIFLISLFLLWVLSFSKNEVTIRYGSAANVNQRILYVPSNFTSIQAAVNNASSGDTVIVASGAYKENLIISKSLTLIGENRGTTIIDGSGVGDTVSVRSNYVNIQELTVINSGTSTRNSGIVIDNCRGVSVNSTQIAGTYYALSLAYCFDSVFSNNLVFNNTFGIQLVNSNNNVFSDNIISANGQGITLENTNNNVFSDNIISANGEGITLDYINRFNVFFGNTFVDNGEGAAIRQSSYGNSFYHNNFLDQITVEAGDANLWSRNGEGNYWSSYVGSDSHSGPGQNETGSDGIGDAGYFLNDNNHDDYPLMGVFSEFNVARENETYPVDIINNSTISNFSFETGKETGNRMIIFNANGKSGTTGFCRIMIPTPVMDYPFTVVTNQGQANLSLLDTSNKTNAYLYFTYPGDNETITVISSDALQLYDSLLDKYNSLQADFENLNATYHGLLESYNSTLQTLLNNFSLMLGNLTQLQSNYSDLNSSLQQNLRDQSDSVQNMRNFTYVFAAMTGAFLITITYLSTRIHASKRSKASVSEQS